MAGDWLKFEISTPHKPEVFKITAQMGWTDADTTVGKLIRVWSWFDQHTTDGHAIDITPALIDQIASAAGFAKAMVDAGWLTISKHGVMLDNFDRHNGMSAKKRVLTARRVAKHRSTVLTEINGNAEIVTPVLAREEKKRKEKRIPEGQPQCNTPSPTTPMFTAFDFLVKNGVSEDVARDWLLLRKAKSLPNTKTGIKGVLAEISKTGMTAEEGLEICCKRNWLSFNALWIAAPAASQKSVPWFTSNESVAAKAAEIGIFARPGESNADFKQRVESSMSGGQRTVSASPGKVNEIYEQSKRSKPPGLDLLSLVKRKVRGKLQPPQAS